VVSTGNVTLPLCNLAAVWGQMATGGGHALLTESMTVMGIPVMTKKAFVDAEKRIDEGGGPS